jgi:hypothetical protein
MRLESRIGVLLIILAIPVFVVPFFLLHVTYDLEPSIFVILDVIVPAMIAGGVGLLWHDWRKKGRQADYGSRLRLLRQYLPEVFVELDMIEASPEELSAYEFEEKAWELTTMTEGAMIGHAVSVRNDDTTKYDTAYSLRGEMQAYAIAQLRNKIGPTST